MPTFAANLSMLFTELPFLERFAAARAAGFKHVEYLYPYDYEADALAKLLKDNSLTQVLFNMPAGDWAGGDRGIASHPDRVDEFRAGVPKAIAYAKALGVPRLNCLSGKLLPGVSEAAQRACLVENLRFAADALAAHGLKLLVEFINRNSIPGFFLHRTDQTLAVMDEAGRGNIFLQYDIFHAQRSEGELTDTIRKHIARIDHMQLADTPGRHEPGTGEINFPFLFAAIDTPGLRRNHRPGIRSRKGHRVVPGLDRQIRDHPVSKPT